jgi:hypothetical protein
MMRFPLFCAICVFLLTCGCSATPKRVTRLGAADQSPRPFAAVENDSIREAVYRFKIDQYRGVPKADRVFFLAIRAHDSRRTVDPDDIDGRSASSSAAVWFWSF